MVGYSAKTDGTKKDDKKSATAAASGISTALLVPLFAIYGAALVATRAPAFRIAHRPVLIGAALTVTVLMSVWIRQIVISDFARITALLSHAG